MWNPEDYAKNSDAQLKWARSLTANLNLEEYQSILDVGCGDGKITADFARQLVARVSKGARCGGSPRCSDSPRVEETVEVANSLPKSRIVGVDASAEMIAYACEKYPASQYPNLTFDCVDARSLEFTSEFDLLFSNATLHWVDNHQGFLKGANQALKDNGRLIISCGGKGNAAEILATFAELTAADNWKPYFADFYNPYFFYGLDDYQRWLEQAGFEVKRLELVPKDMTHQGIAGLTGWIRTTWMPLTKYVPEAQRDEFIAQFVKLYEANNPLDLQGLTHVSMVRLEVDANKRASPQL
jgi:trans-aconitate 2-methyltransferase